MCVHARACVCISFCAVSSPLCVCVFLLLLFLYVSPSVCCVSPQLWELNESSERGEIERYNKGLSVYFILFFNVQVWFELESHWASGQ